MRRGRTRAGCPAGAARRTAVCPVLTMSLQEDGDSRGALPPAGLPQ